MQRPAGFARKAMPFLRLLLARPVLLLRLLPAGARMFA
jgi:hypothetical protein